MQNKVVGKMPHLRKQFCEAKYWDYFTGLVKPDTISQKNDLATI